MKLRIISGAVMAALLIIVYFCPPIVFDIAIGLIAAIAYIEIIKVQKDLTIPKIMKLIGFVFVVLIMYTNINTISYQFGIDYRSLVLGLLIMFIPTILIPNKQYSTKEAFFLSSISLFLGLVFNLFIQTFMINKIVLVWLILIASCTDIFALVGGMLIGKHKLTSISPKKTIEGSVVGLIVATIVGSFFYYMAIDGTIQIGVLIASVAGLSVAGQLGDLFFSLIKRENDTKDYSHIIPGHGGVLDRIDSIIFILLVYIVISQFL